MVPVQGGGGGGLGVALMPESAAHRPGDDGVRFLRLEHSATLELTAVRRRGTGPLVGGFVEQVRAAIGGAHPDQ